MFGTPKLSDLDFNDLDFDLPDIEVPEFLKLNEEWALEMDIIPVDAPGLMQRSTPGLGFMGSSKKMKTGRIGLVDIGIVDPSDEVRASLARQHITSLPCWDPRCVFRAGFVCGTS
jgi:hypothetical protein